MFHVSCVFYGVFFVFELCYLIYFTCLCGGAYEKERLASTNSAMVVQLPHLGSMIFFRSSLISLLQLLPVDSTYRFACILIKSAPRDWSPAFPEESFAICSIRSPSFESFGPDW